MTLNVACADCSTRKFGKSRIGVWWGGGTMTQNRLWPILALWASALRASVQIATQFVERATFNGWTTSTKRKGHLKEVAFSFRWRARHDSNVRPPGS